MVVVCAVLWSVLCCGLCCVLCCFVCSPFAGSKNSIKFDNFGAPLLCSVWVLISGPPSLPELPHPDTHNFALVSVSRHKVHYFFPLLGVLSWIFAGVWLSSPSDPTLGASSIRQKLAEIDRARWKVGGGGGGKREGWSGQSIFGQKRKHLILMVPTRPDKWLITKELGERNL